MVNVASVLLQFLLMTSSNGNIFRVTGHLCGDSPVPVNSPHKGQWRGAFMFYLTCVWINGWVNNREADDLRRHCGHCDVNVMFCSYTICLIMDWYTSIFSYHLAKAIHAKINIDEINGWISVEWLSKWKTINIIKWKNENDKDYYQRATYCFLLET